DGKLRECCPFRKHQFDAGLEETPLRVLGEAHAGLPQLAQSFGPEPAQVDEPRQCEERLIRRDVRRRLLASDVLLAGLEGEDIAALARGVYRLPDDAARHAADELVARGEEAVLRPREELVVTRALPFADRHPAAVRARRFEHAE